MNFELSDEQRALQEAARGTLSRHKTIEAARDALDGGERLDLWDAAREVGWPGLLISEDHGGAGLGALDAMLVMSECGRVLASVPLLGHVPATAVLDGAEGQEDLLAALAEGEKRAAFVGAQPPGDLDDAWTVDSVRGHARPDAPRAEVDGEAATVSGTVGWVPDAPGADVLVVTSVDGDGAVRALLVETGADGVQIEAVTRYDATRLLGHVRLDGAPATVLSAGEVELSSAWYLAQGLLAAESLGAV